MEWDTKHIIGASVLKEKSQISANTVFTFEPIFDHQTTRMTLFIDVSNGTSLQYHATADCCVGG
jgi:hypothetical protein